MQQLKLKCIAIDDEPLALKLLLNYAAKTPNIEIANTFGDAIAAIDFIKASVPDLLFVDINMPDISGIDLVRSLQQKPMIIFTTAYKKFAYEGFELEAVDYLLKPFSHERFSKAVDKAVALYNQKTAPVNVSMPESIYVRSEYKMVQILLTDIDYVEALEDYIKIHLLNARPILTLMTLKAFADKLPGEFFKRIHRSYIVPVAKIKSMANKKLTLQSGVILPVSDTYYTTLFNWLSQG